MTNSLVSKYASTSLLVSYLALFAWQSPISAAGAEPTIDMLSSSFQAKLVPLLGRYCFQCHAGDRVEAEIELDTFKRFEDVRRNSETWQKIGEMLDSRQMPPPDAAQPTEDERRQLQTWVRDYLLLEARASSGDSGPVLLRRLSNTEYTNTLRDLTGIRSLDPAREFPVDSAAGEGFTNTGNALVMSPALVTKYLDAAKEIAEHAVLLPDGFRFSAHATRRDWTNEILDQIREYYRQFSDNSGGTSVNLQGIQFDTNQGGRLPVEKYLAATLQESSNLRDHKKSIDTVAQDRNLNAKYLRILWETLALGTPPTWPGQDTAPNTRTTQEESLAPNRGHLSIVLNQLRARWLESKVGDEGKLAADIGQWQSVLWRFNSIGHIGRQYGRDGGPSAWMEPTNPIVERQEFRLKFPSSPPGADSVLYLSVGNAGDGPQHDYVLWEQPRLVTPGRPDLHLRDLRALADQLATKRAKMIESTTRCLKAASEAADLGAADLGQLLEPTELARRHDVDPDTLAAWLDFLGIGSSGPAKLGALITKKTEMVSGYGFIQGWVGDDALSVLANSSDNAVRIPGNMKAHGVAVHPTPKLSVGIGWKSPQSLVARISGVIQHAHPECGNGTAWSLEVRQGNTRQRLATGTTKGANEVPIGPIDNVRLRVGDAVVLLINPKDGNHSCDLTAIDLTIGTGQTVWNLAREISPKILVSNPLPDGHGNQDVWHFFSEPAESTSGHTIPPDSMLAEWLSKSDVADRGELSNQIQILLTQGPGPTTRTPDVNLYHQLTSLSGPLLTAALQSLTRSALPTTSPQTSPFGIDPSLFGKHPIRSESPNEEAADKFAVSNEHLCVRAPSLLEIRLPRDLTAGAEFVVTASLHPHSAREGSVQVSASLEKPSVGQPSVGQPSVGELRPATVLATEGSAARKRFEAALHDVRQLFPPALCYTKIVPVDEAVTLTLFYREDQHLQRLMLDPAQAARLQRIWDELFYVSQEPLLLATAFEQISEFATQDRPDMVKAFAPMRKPINDRAKAFEQGLVSHEPAQLEALVRFASQVYRRPITEVEASQLRSLYQFLRDQGLRHEEAFRSTLARQFVAPAFLYRVELPATGAKQAPVNDWELASRLSYFLWSSPADDELYQLASAGRLHNPDTIWKQTQRMLRSPKSRWLAIEFGCQWLQIRDFDQHDEKSERHFPNFSALRESMYEESIQFLTDLIQRDRSILELIDADYVIVNPALAVHYGIPFSGEARPDEWRRVEGVKRYGRGGLLSHASVLAKQSGASRTSPILRGNWLSEVVMGEKLPRPPKDVPQLDDVVPAGLTERQLIEKHSSDPACAKCHARIDPLGFALEQFDAIGRLRERDSAGHRIDARSLLPDGATIEGLAGLQKYLLNERREAFVRQFCRKLLGYALGRSVQLSDEPLLADMQSSLKSGEYRFSKALEQIVLSRQFREIRGTP